MSSAVFFQIQSGLILTLMLFGVWNHKKRSLHVKTMSTVIAWDILLVLQIELTRSAVAKASQALTNTVLLNIHVSFAITTVVLYFFMIYTGRKLIKGNISFRKKHKVLGKTVVVLRILTFATSFFAAPIQGL